MKRVALSLAVGGLSLAALPACATEHGLLPAPYSWGYYGAGLTFSHVTVTSLVTPSGAAGGVVSTVTAPIYARVSGPADGDATLRCTGNVACEQIGSLQFQYSLWKGQQSSLVTNRVGAAIMGGFQLTDAADTNSNFSFLQIYQDASTPGGYIDGGTYSGKFNGGIPRWNANPAALAPGWNYGSAYQYQFFDVPYDLVGISPLENVAFETALATYDPATGGVNILADVSWSFDTSSGTLTGQPVVFNGAPSGTLLSLYGAGFPYASYTNDILGLAAAVPEPAAWASMMLGFGLSGRAIRRLSRRRRILRRVSAAV